jgi:hypothetical protein
MDMLPALVCPISLLGRVDVSLRCVHREGHNWIVAQDLIGVCHMHTYVHKKIIRHMKLRAHTRNTANCSLCLYRRFRPHVVPTHYCLTPVITVSWSSVPPSFLAFIVVLVLFRGFLMVRICLKKISKSLLLVTLKNWMYVSHEKELVPWIFLRWHASIPSLPPGKIWRFLQYKECTVQN